ncbi:MAG TPA: gluconokinase, GntK/IdnK-type [Candidatus Binataceae bacterium]|nr:gluconokinase, GntK/IdnK-type [Candidatus Binataceae bacterium]
MKKSHVSVVVVMGVAGSGKSTIGRLLAEKLGWEFADADELHSEANCAKMNQGIALSDEDRQPWLEAVRDLIARRVADGRRLVVACSALKQAYRDAIAVEPDAMVWAYLKGERDLIARRLAGRRNHFFDPALLASQFDTLEEPRDAIVEDIGRDPDTIAKSICARLVAHGREQWR